MHKGFRLKRLELLNWGTFNRRVNILAPEGGWTLLVGDNGSGKSTAVDALRTLLVPPRLLALSYNDSGKEVASKRRADRSKRSYVRGAWSRTSRDDSAEGKIEYLRSAGVQTVLLAVFHDQSRRRTVTIAQILWESNEKVDEVYAVAEADKNIRDHIAGADVLRDIRRKLQNNGFWVSTTYSAYAERFRGLMGIPSEAALEVFNQAIGVKQIDDLNRFIRQHMLTGHDAADFIKGTLQPHYTELHDCQRAIDRAEKQIRALEPIAETWSKLQAATAEKERLEALIKIASLFFDLKLFELLSAAIVADEASLTTHELQKNALDHEQEADRAERDNLKAALARDAAEIRIQELQSQIRNASSVLQARQQRAQAFAKHLTVLQGPPMPASAADFAEVRQWSTAKSLSLRTEYDTARERCISLESDKRTVAQKYANLRTELVHLQGQKALIPNSLSLLRAALCEAAGLRQMDLPFVGELVQVHAAFRDWTGVIERLLHGFGLSLLVPERCYEAVSSYVNGRRLVDPSNPRYGIRLEYYLITHLPQQPIISGDSRMVCGRLEFHPSNPLSRWVAAAAAQRFRHICCPTVEEFHRHPYAVTREGLVRNGERHLKDDRRDIADPSEYVLGWSNEAKLEAVQRQCVQLNSEIATINRESELAARREQHTSRLIVAVEALLSVTSFAEIDVQETQGIIHSLRQQIATLESSEARRALTSEIALVEKRISNRGSELDKVTGNIAILKKSIGDNRNRLRAPEEDVCRRLDVPAIQQQLIALAIPTTLTLEEIDEARMKAANVVREEISRRDNSVRQLGPILQKRMTSFLGAWPEECKDLHDEIEYAPEFVQLLQKLKDDELPKHQKRFEEFLGTNLVGDIASFNARLHDDEKAIRLKIRDVNEALKNIPFSSDTYLEVVTFPNRTEEISEFKAHVLRCLSRTLHPEPEERPRIFEQIGLLMQSFNTDERWMRRVTDVRNWLDFGVKVRSHLDDSEIQFFDKSSGISVGQKARLAFAILGAAISAQYRLLGGSDDRSTFRLVVIDEVFGSTDEEKSIRALEVFRALDLQLVIVSPFDAKARIAEDYVDSFHLTTNPTLSDSRLRKATRAEYNALGSKTETYAATGGHS